MEFGRKGTAEGTPVARAWLHEGKLRHLLRTLTVKGAFTPEPEYAT